MLKLLKTPERIGAIEHRLALAEQERADHARDLGALGGRLDVIEQRLASLADRIADNDRREQFDRLVLDLADQRREDRERFDRLLRRFEELEEQARDRQETGDRRQEDADRRNDVVRADITKMDHALAAMVEDMRSLSAVLLDRIEAVRRTPAE
jgi:chromosome segregation ATPase